MSGAWPGYVGYSSVLWHRDLGGMARMWPSSSDMNVQGTGIAGLDSESQATSGSRLGESSYFRTNSHCRSAD